MNQNNQFLSVFYKKKKFLRLPFWYRCQERLYDINSFNNSIE